MNKLNLKKNRLDLEYRWELQNANIFLSLLTIGLVAFLSSFIFLKDKDFFNFGLITAFIIFISSLIMYKEKSKRLSKILNEIEELT